MNETPDDARPTSGRIDIGTLDAYISGDWAVVLEIEAADFFEREEPPSFVLYADLYRNGVPVGRVDVVTRIEIRGRELWLTELHMHGLAGGGLGRAGLNALAQAVMEDADVEALVVEGGTRSSGLRRGRTPKPVRFVRRPDPPRGPRRGDAPAGGRGAAADEERPEPQEGA
jgi:hypothetical protein